MQFILTAKLIQERPLPIVSRSIFELIKYYPKYYV